MPQSGLEIARIGLVWVGLTLVLLAAITDVRRFVIPNRICLALLGIGVMYALLTPGFPWVANGLAMVLVFAVGFVLFSVGLLGGGDVKLVTALSFWFGWAGMWPFLVVTALAGGVVSLVYFGRAWMRSRKAGGADGRSLWGTTVPYGVAIAAGGVYALMQLSNGRGSL